MDDICALCGSDAKQVKAGLKNGRQQFKCTSCGRRYVAERHANRHAESVKQQAGDLHAQGRSLRQIGAAIGVSPRTVGYWVQKAGEQAPAQTPSDSNEIAPAVGDAPAKRRVTIHDVARRAGVAVSTVSNFLNNKGRMTPATRDHVQSAIDELNYIPSALTRAIRNRRTGILGVVAYGFFNLDVEVGYSIIPPILAGINRTAEALGYDVLLYTSWFVSESVGGIRFLDGHIDGLLTVSATLPRPIVDRIASVGLPMVSILNRDVPDTVGFVDGENVAATKAIVEHLVSLGRRRIGYYTTLNVSDHVDRYRAFGEAMKAAGLGWDPAPMTYAIRPLESWSQERIDQGLECLADMAGELDAMVVTDDHWAMRLIDKLARRGVRVPDDVAVVGFNDVHDAATYAGGITTVRQRFRQIGQVAVERLLALIDGAPASECRVSLPTELIVRASTVGPDLSGKA